MFIDPNTVDNPATGFASPAAWGDTIRDDLMALYGSPRVRVARGSTQAIPNATLTAVLFDGEHVDSHGMHPAGSSSQLIVPTNWAGDYLVGATVQWAVNTGGARRHGAIWLNNSLKLIDDELPASAGGYATQTLVTYWPAAAVGDYFELKVFQDSGGSLNVNNDGYAGTILWAKFMGGTGVG